MATKTKTHEPIIPVVTEGAEKPAKVGRGRNPNSLKNLKPFPKGVSGNPGRVPAGPMVTPALRRFAAMTLPELKALDKETMTGADAIAFTYIMDSLTTGSFSTGAKSRDAVTTRLDGDGDKKGDTFNIDKAILVRYVEGGP